MQRILLLLSFCVAGWSVRAEHLPGGSITYECLGDNVYEVTLTLYRACSGAAMLPQSLTYQNDCGLNFTVTDMLPSDTLDASQICGASASNSTCNGGAIAGYQAFLYVDTIFLSPCNAWTIHWSTCCRQASLNLMNTPGLYIEAKLNNVVAPCNSSSVFTSTDVPHVCAGQPVVYDAGAVDDAAVRRRFRLVDARFYNGQPFPVNYLFPNYGGEPIAGMTMDEEDGRISFTPPNIGVIVTVVQVEEFDENDVWIGTVMRDLPFVVVACSSAPPSASSGLLTAPTGACEVTADREVRVCSSGDFCFNAVFTDPNAGDLLSLESNIGWVLPGATIQTNGTNPLTAQVCGNAVDLPFGAYAITITVSDNSCPIVGTQSFTYALTVEEAPYAGADGTATVCSLSQPFLLFDSLSGAPPAGGFWDGPNGPANDQFHPATDTGGTYVYNVEAFPGCYGTAQVEVQFLPEDDPYCVYLGIGTAGTMGVRVHPNPASRDLVITGIPIRYGVVRLELVDLAGRAVWNGVFTNSGAALMLDLPTTVPSGVWSLRMKDPDGLLIQHTSLFIVR
ncbi:MAG: hypothetical protein R2815_05170 [Flavobacteriales bacterium]